MSKYVLICLNTNIQTNNNTIQNQLTLNKEMWRVEAIL